MFRPSDFHGCRNEDDVLFVKSANRQRTDDNTDLFCLQPLHNVYSAGMKGVTIIFVLFWCEQKVYDDDIRWPHYFESPDGAVALFFAIQTMVRLFGLGDARQNFLVFYALL